MKSAILIPYCPLPADDGGKAGIWKALACLRELGPCTILTARRRPVGAGWTPAALAELQRGGFSVVFREDGPGGGVRAGHLLGLAYAAACKALGLERAFGHANPYHRLAFDPAWVARHTAGMDLAVFTYSFWAGFPTPCPKAVFLLDLWSDYMWGGCAAETRDLRTAELVIVISKQEQARLRERGIGGTLWSPPFVAAIDAPDSGRIGLIGSANPFNREGLAWLGAGIPASPVRVYGGLAAFATREGFEAVGRYAELADPYRECGIVLMTTTGGMGVQVKTIEALAAGRAIVARRGAMRGIPPGDGAWVEVDSPAAMRETALRLQRDPAARAAQMAAARSYYAAHLDVGKLRAELRQALLRAAAKGRVSSP